MSKKDVKAKPKLFNTDMVRAILDGRKTVTRRVMKPQKEGMQVGTYINGFDQKVIGARSKKGDVIVSPHQPGDILYVRETFFERKGKYYYKADGKHLALNDAIGGKEFFKWHPSIHMPKEAARIFLRVKDVIVHRVQDITDEQARSEGCKDRDDYSKVWDECYASPQPVKENGVIVRYESYPWEDVQEIRTYRGLPWIVVGNPWVWAIKFERICKEEVTA